MYFLFTSIKTARILSAILDVQIDRIVRLFKGGKALQMEEGSF